MSYSNSLRSMSTASSNLSSLSTFVPYLSGGATTDTSKMVYLAAAALTIYVNCDMKSRQCKNPRAVIAALLIGIAVFACSKRDCEINIGKAIASIPTINGQGLLLGGLVGYAGFEAYKIARNRFGYDNLLSKITNGGAMDINDDQLSMVAIVVGAYMGM